MYGLGCRWNMTLRRPKRSPAISRCIGSPRAAGCRKRLRLRNKMAKNFDAWWNEHYFYEKNGPLYRAFEKFDQLEGDLDYVDFLRKVLRWGDANLAKSPPDRARRRLESFVRSYDKELAENFQYIGLLAIEFTKRKRAER